MNTSSSDLDEELPVFDFLQPRGHKQKLLNKAAVSSVKDGAEAQTPAANAVLISSDSDDDGPYVPLAQRLKQRQGHAISAISTLTNGEDAESEPQIVPAALSREVAAFPQRWPPKGTTNGTMEEIQTSGGEAVMKKTARKELRQEQERQKAERKALAQTAKALRPEECIKYMVVAVDPALLQQEGGGTLLAAVQALGCSCAVEKQTLPRSVSWMRRTPGAQPADGQCVPEAHVVMQMTVDDFITLIHSYIQEERLGRSESGPTLISWVQQQQRRHPSKILSLAVIDLEKYFRSQKSQSRKHFREAVTGEEKEGGKAKKRRKNATVETLPEVSRVEVEEAVVHLQLHTDVSVRFLSTWKDFSDHITRTTKAVAEAPFKRERDKTGFSFHLESEWAGGQRVDRAGKGLLQVWKKQIQQLNRVSPDMAEAILAVHPSPQLLRKAYSKCKSDKERISLLSELLIRRGEGITSTSRRVGPELSKRLLLLMTSSDPQQSLDSV